MVNGVFLLGAAAALENVHIDGLFEAVVVVLGLSLVTMLFGGVLALDRGDLWFRHIVRRQLRRSQLARHTDVPGFLFLEIDGLAHGVLRRALRDGNAPFLARWIHDDGYKLHGWETHWSSQTGACQAGLLHGDDHDMPAFRWWEKDLGRAIVTNHPRDAEEIERRHSNGRGLLHDDGASRANILSGDATHSMLTMSTVLDLKRDGRLGQDYFAYFASPYGVARTVLRTLGEIAVERWSAVQQVRRDVRPRVHRGWSYAGVRAFGTVIQLDLQVAAVTADILAGRPSCTRRSSPTTRSRTTPGSSGRTRWPCCGGWTARSRTSPRRCRTRRDRTGSSCSATTARARARRSSNATAKGSKTSWSAMAAATCGPRTRSPTRAAPRSPPA